MVFCYQGSLRLRYRYCGISIARSGPMEMEMECVLRLEGSCFANFPISLEGSGTGSIQVEQRVGMDGGESVNF